jgi:hypothetical protein
MRKLILGAALALVLPATAAAAADEAAPAALAKAACKTEKHAMGTKLFKKTYGAKSTSKAMKACVAKAQPAAATEAKNAAKECKAERDADPEAFKDYGTNDNNKNAFGKCVSGKASEATQEAAEERSDAAKTCKTLKRDETDAFADAYGSGKHAFGKCVSATAKADDDGDG